MHARPTEGCVFGGLGWFLFFLPHLLWTEAFCLYSLTFIVLAQLLVMNAPLFQTVLEEITSIHSIPFPA